MKIRPGRFPGQKLLKKRSKRTAKKVSKAVKSYVKRAIHRNEENKVIINYGANQSLSTANTSTPAYLNLVPLPVQGTAQNQRIGNTIKVVKGFIRGHVNLLPYNASTNPYVGPVMIKMWLASNRQYNTNLLSSTNCATDFFEIGASTTGFQGNMLDIELTNNKDNWIIHKTKTFELGTTGIAGFANQNSSSWNDNSKFTVPFYFSFGHKMRKQIKFVDGATAPSNINMFLIFQAVYADGSNSAVTPAEYHYTSRVEYEDA